MTDEQTDWVRNEAMDQIAAGETTAGEARKALREMRSTLADTFEQIERERGSMLFPDEMADAFLASDWLGHWRFCEADEREDADLPAWDDPATPVLDRVPVPVADEAAACGLCGKPAAGLADIDGVRYCHDDTSPTCYERAQWSRETAPELLSAPVADDVREAVRLADCGEDPVCPLPGIENACEKHLAEFKAWKATR